MSTKTDTKKTTESFSAEEKAAMKARARELKAEERAGRNREEGEKAVFAAIAQMAESDRVMAARLHEIITDSAPDLTPKTWYGMPAYANKEGKVICFYQAASKFNVRYATFGFQHDANLDDGNLWPTGFALIQLTAAEEAKIKALVKKAAG
ncbi:MAG: iron chaperone [Chloroflexota bacterium]